VGRSDATDVVRRAWRELPPAARTLLEQIRAHEWKICEGPLGDQADALLRSADRVVLLNAAHPALKGLDEETFDWALTRTAWHEWAHALSIDRAGREAVRAGPHYLERAPVQIANLIREAGYRRDEYTHEIVAEVYALLMIRRRAGQTGRPDWLDQEIFELVKGVAGWNQ
jgi:hypothetical protein